MAKTILITGATSGLGKHIALTYAATNIHLVLTGRREALLKEVADECRAKGAEVTTSTVDVTDRAAMTTLIHDTHAKTPIHVVIANAGISGGTGDQSLEEFDQMHAIFETNVRGVINTILPALPLMIEQGFGHVAAVSSMAGYHGFPGAGAYCASKAAVKSLCESWRVKLKPDNIDVTCICPGFVETPMTDVNPYDMPFIMKPEKAARLVKKGLDNKKRMIAFPLPTRLGAWFISILPYALSDRFLAKTPVKPPQ